MVVDDDFGAFALLLIPPILLFSSLPEALLTKEDGSLGSGSAMGAFPLRFEGTFKDSDCLFLRNNALKLSTNPEPLRESLLFISYDCTIFTDYEPNFPGALSITY